MPITPEIINSEESFKESSANINIFNWLKVLSENPSALINRLFYLGDLVLATGSGNTELSKLIGAEMLKKVDLVMENDDGRLRVFPDKELRPIFHKKTDLRNKHVMVIQSFAPAWSEDDMGINDQLMELFFAIDAARLASASEITAVLPYFSYGRSDKKDLPKVSIEAKLIAKFIKEAGADRTVTINPHKDQIAGYFDGPFDIVYSREFFVPIIKKKLNLNNLVLIAADGGVEKKSRKWSQKLLGHRDIGVTSKSRDANNGDSKPHFYRGPDLAGKTVLFVDDLIAGGSTLIDAAEIATFCGAKEIYCVAPHALFLGDALKRFKESSIKEIWTTNTIRQRPEVHDSNVTGDKIKVHNIAPFLADKLTNVHTGESMNID